MHYSVREVNIGYYLSRYDVFRYTTRSKNVYLGTVRSVFSLLVYLFTNIFTGKRINKLLGGRDIVVLVGTNNQVRSIEALSTRNEVGFITYRTGVASSWSFINKVYIDKMFSRLIRASIYLFKEYKQEEKNGWLVLINLNEYILAEIRRDFLFEYFESNAGITDLFILNELKGEFRSAVLAARDAGVRSWYVPHGITLDLQHELVPICDVYLFSGKYEVRSYTEGIYDRRLYYMTRQVYKNIEKSLVYRKKSIGLASNSGSDYGKVKRLIQKLKTWGYDVIYRPHPGHDQRKEKNFSIECGVEYSNSNTESLDKYFRYIEFFFCGNTSMVIDSLLRGRKTAIVDIDIDSMDADLLGFVSNSMVPYLSSDSVVKEYLLANLMFVGNNMDIYVTENRCLTFDLINNIRHE